MSSRVRRWLRQPVAETAGPPGREAGMITVFTSLAAVALLLMVGFVVDGGGRMRAVGRADRIAAEAARAAVEAADTRGPTLTLDHLAAVAAANAYLRAAGATGTVTVTGPRTVRVTATVTGHYLILGLVGASSYEVAGAATASLAVGVTTGDTP
jgi:Flp pilus assembly protein TadG